MFFKCKVCEEKDKRILDLKKQIEFYQKMLNPNPSIPALHIEANKILDGANDNVFEITDDAPNKDEFKERAVVEHEFNNIVSGNY